MVYRGKKNTLLHLSLLGSLVSAAMSSTTDEKQNGPILRKRAESNGRGLKKGSLEALWDQVAAKTQFEKDADEYNELARGLFSMPAASPVTVPTLSPVVCNGVSREDYLLALLSQVTPVNQLENRFTPQGKAFEFLKTDPYLENPCGKEVAQRYGLATMFYSTDGEKWTNKDGWLESKNECEWSGVICDSSGMVAKLDLGKSK